jgi:transposase
MDFDALSRPELIALLKQAFATIGALKAQVTALQTEVATLKEEIERLKGSPPPKAKPVVPAFVKPNVKPRQPAPRKKRPHGFARKRQTPTETVVHAPQSCSCCGRKLSGGWVHRTREVIELPEAPIRIIEHKIMGRHCGVCGKRQIASPDLSDTVVGHSRLGIRLMSLIAYLDTVCRMPVRSIKRLLEGLYGLTLSVGEICKVLQKVAAKGKPTYEKLLAVLRVSSAVNADETSWRENGKNGYAWSFSTPEIHYFVCQRNRSSEVVKEVLGSAFASTLVTDFYSAYHYHILGPHQYCWPHLLRDVHPLKEQYPEDAQVTAFAEGVHSLYKEAKEYSHPSVFARQKKRREFEERIRKLAQRHLGADRPERVLAERILKRSHGLFVFVEKLDVPSDNNAAERSLRPLVVMRKVSGGTRSDAGSNTVAVLMSLFTTWHAQKKDALLTCQQMLRGKSVFASG